MLYKEGEAKSLLSILGILFLILFSFFVSSSGSENYNSSIIVSDGGDNLSSTNYEQTIIVGEVSGNTSSTNYDTRIGFLSAHTQNHLPVVTLLDPDHDNTTNDRTPTFTWSGYDADRDDLTYNIKLECYSSLGGGCSDDNRDVDLISEETYTIQNYLQYLSDNNYYYNWSVRANDGIDYGEWSEVRTINIQSLINVTLDVDNINFGSIVMGGSNDTDNDNPPPFELSNYGNCLNNVTINSTALWESVENASEDYRFKIDNKTGEEGSFDSASSNITWTNMVFGSPLTSIVGFDWNTSKNTLETDVYVSVPGSEGSGSRSSVVKFVASLGE